LWKILVPNYKSVDIVIVNNLVN